MAVNTDDISVIIQRLLVQPLEQASTLLGSGVRIFDTTAPISIPRLRGDFAPGWVRESELIPHPSPTCSYRAQLRPRRDPCPSSASLTAASPT